MKQYNVDAFTNKIFHGNQAVICVLDQWIPEDMMMDITKENNFSESAFVAKEGEKYHLRWFTPGGEIDLCGHATLACAYVLLNHYVPQEDKIVFATLSGDLTVTRKGSLLEGGTLYCRVEENKVFLAGEAVLFSICDLQL